MMCFSHASLALGPPTLKIDAPFRIFKRTMGRRILYAFVVLIIILGFVYALIPWKIFCGSDQGERFNVAESLSPKVPHLSAHNAKASLRVGNKSKSAKKPLGITKMKSSVDVQEIPDHEKAKRYILNRKNVRYMNLELLKTGSHDNKILLFSFCIPGKGAEVKHGNPGLLCSAWWETMKVWYENVESDMKNVQVALVHSNKNYNFIDKRRSPHWLKIILLYAFLETDFKNDNGEKFSYSTVVFIDSDSVVRLPRWNIAKYINETMFSHVKLLLSQDASDFVSTGEIFAKRLIAPFLLDWYTRAPEFYGRLLLPHETYLGRLKVNNGFTNKVENFAAYSKVKYFWKNAKAFVDHGKYTEPLNSVKENAPVQRCWPTLPTHEQGCFSHVFNAYGKKFSVHVKIVKSQEMHSFRLMKQNPPPHWRAVATTPFLHYCCSKYAERVAGLKMCRDLLRQGRPC